jgi:hypothetical protein
MLAPECMFMYTLQLSSDYYKLRLVFSEIRTESLVGRHVNRRLSLSDFNSCWKLSANFSKTS